MEVIWKRKLLLKTENVHFSPKNWFFIDKKYFPILWNRGYSDRSKLDIYDETIRIKTISVKTYDEETAENYQIFTLPIVFKQYKISIQNFNNKNWRLESRLCQNFKPLSCIHTFWEISR